MSEPRKLKKSESLEIRIPYPTKQAFMARCRDGGRSASEALRLLLPSARAEGLTWVELTTDTDNAASQKVITNNGGHLVEAFDMPAAYGEGVKLRYRIPL